MLFYGTPEASVTANYVLQSFKNTFFFFLAIFSSCSQ